MNGLMILKLVAEEFMISPEAMKGRVSKLELEMDEDIIHNAVCTYCYILKLPEVREVYEKCEWSLNGCVKIIGLSENQFKSRVRYYKDVLIKYSIHKKHLKYILKEFKSKKNV